MTRGEIRRVFSHLYEEGLRVVFLQGGEPLVRRDLPEILEGLASRGFHLSLITNGTKFTESLSDRLEPLKVNISISLDTLHRERYQRIRGRDQLPEVFNGIKLLQNYPHPKYLTCIVNNQNRHDVLDVARFARAHGCIPVIRAYHWDLERYGKIDLTLQYEQTVARKVFEQVVESDYFRPYLHDNITWLSGKSLALCDAEKYSIAIDASGNVAPCLALKNAGNLLKQSLPQILSRFDTNRIRNCSDQSSCNMLYSRVIGSVLRHPIQAVITPTRLNPLEGAYAGSH